MDATDLIRLRHMLDAAREVMGFCGGKRKADLDSDRKLLLAVLRDLEIIGEAAARIAESTRSSLPRIPWEDIIGMRNKLIHGYLDVNSDIVWQTVIEDLPQLESLLVEATSKEERP